MKIKFLTWNIDNNKTQKFYQDLNNQVTQDEIDILIIQEGLNDEFIFELTDFEEIKDFLNEKGRRWVRVFINKKSKLDYSSQTSYASNKIKCFELTDNNSFKINVIAVHLYSKAGKSNSQQLFENKEIPKYIEEFEIKQNNTKTIIVGDLNYCPFDKELSYPEFLNTVSDREVIRLFQKRKIGQKSYRYFYNPMWNLLGDFNFVLQKNKPPGTYFWAQTDIDRLHWNLIDGVLLSPELMYNIELNSIILMDTINGKSLINNAINHQFDSLLDINFSDHLPVSFSIKI